MSPPGKLDERMLQYASFLTLDSPMEERPQHDASLLLLSLTISGFHKKAKTKK
jgi:hypothetical protein